MNDESNLYREFIRQFMVVEARLRAFLRSQLPTWQDVDDVLQDTCLVAWKKFGQFEPGSNFAAWITTIARFEALNHRRTLASQRLVFSDDVFDLVADEGDADEPLLEAQHQALLRCLDKMPANQARWLQLAYQPGARIHEAAAAAGKSVQAFYKTLQRLRGLLQECMNRQMQEESLS